MKTISILSVLVGITGLLLFGGPTGEVLADGTEVLGPPGPPINIASGTGIVAAGTGLFVQPGTININIPTDAAVEQVLLYWSGEFSVSDDNTVTVNGNSVTGTLIGGPTFFFRAGGADIDVSAYRADITNLELVTPGANTLTVVGLNYVGPTGSDFENGNHGAGVLVIIDEGGAQSDIDVRDGVDLAFCDFPEPRQTAVAQEYSFAPANVDRVADLAMFFGSTFGVDAPETRTNEIVIQVFQGLNLVDTTTLVNTLQSNDGKQWDTETVEVDIPAGAHRVVVQPISGPTTDGNLCASFSWVAATLAVPGADEPELCSIGDFVWEDANRDGCQDDERPIEGVEVTLLVYDDCDNDLIETKTTTTNVDGFYEFTGLVCGKEYRVQFGDAGDIYDYTKFESCLEDPPPGSNDPTNDSDCNGDDEGRSACVTFLDPTDPNFEPNNPTIDCGYVCEGVIGDRVWLDENENEGCQDPGEPDIGGVTATLFQVDGCPDVSNLPEKPFMTKPTIDGKYLFTGLCPGDYRVTFDDPAGRENTVANINCPDLPPDDQGGDTKDSDCGSDDECVTLTKDTPVIPNTDPVQIGDLTIDCGKIPPPENCDLEIDKKCRVETPPVDFEKCDGKLQQFTVIWTGSQITVSGVTNDAPGGVVDTGQAVTFFGPFDTNDVIVNLEGATPSQSKFHVSCSDSDFNSPDDCGKSAGNGKGDDSNFNNDWELEGFIDKNGLVLDCSGAAGDGPFTDNCEFEKQAVNCETFDKPSSLTFRYEGNGPVSECTDNAASRANQKPPTCSGDLPVGATVMISLNDGSADPMSVAPGEEFTITGFGSQTEITLTNADVGSTEFEVDDFHTSCSAPLELGDVFGNLTLVSWDGQDGSVDVTYSYEVTNLGDPLTDVVVKDDKLGDIGTIPSLATRQSEILESGPVPISDTTTNIAFATGFLPSSGDQCPSDSDSVTVTAKEPTCDVAIAFEKLEDDKIKWKITNTSSIVATLETFRLFYPDSSYGFIKEIKLDGAIYKASESSLVVMSGTWITESDWTQTDVSKRQLDPGETRTLEVVFTQKGDRNGWLAISDLGGVTFKEGCEVEFPVVGGCALGKPTALVFEYTGAACSATTNFQEGKIKCEETGALGDLVKVEMTKDANKISVQLSGNEVNIFYDDPEGEKFPSEIKYKITGSTGNTQSQTLHTSCSKQLNEGDQFGALILQEFIPED